MLKLREMEPSAEYSVDSLKSCLKQSIPQDSPLILIGNSLGGHLAIEIAGDFPLCQGVVIFGTPPLKKPVNAEEAFLPSDTLNTYLKADYTEEELEKTFEKVTVHPHVRAQLKKGFVDTYPLFRQHFVHSGLVIGQLGNEVEMVANLGLPVHVIHGLQDPSANLDYIRALPGISKIHEIDNCGHFPSVEQPEKFAAIVDKIAGSIFGK